MAKLSKTTKKLDNNVIKALTIVCEGVKPELVGFEWLTHSANYANFPASLLVTCVFDNQASLTAMLDNQQDIELKKQIQQQLLKVGILLKDVRRHVCFDTDEACLAEHDGDWNQRLSLL